MRGPAERAVLCDVTDEQRCDTERLRVPNEPACALAHLARRPGLRAAGRVRHRLDGVDDEDRRLELPRRAHGGIEVRRRQHVASVDGGLQALGSAPDLLARLLRRDEQRRHPPVGRARQRLEYEGGLADAGFTAEQGHRARDQSAPQDPVELPDPGRHRHGGGRADRSEWQRGGAGTVRERPRRPRVPARPGLAGSPGHRLLGDGVPLSAGRAASGPAR